MVKLADKQVGAVPKNNFVAKLNASYLIQKIIEYPAVLLICNGLF